MCLRTRSSWPLLQNLVVVVKSMDGRLQEKLGRWRVVIFLIFAAFHPAAPAPLDMCRRIISLDTACSPCTSVRLLEAFSAG